MGHKFLILLPTYNRKEMVKTAIDSVLSQNYDNFILAIIDDNDRWTVDCDIINHKKVDYIVTGDSDAEKKAQGGSRHGEKMNDFMSDYSLECDIVLILCDDDALIPGYLSALNKYYTENDEKYSYCHVRKWNPNEENIDDVGDRKLPIHFNKTDALVPAGRVDASQVSWFLSDDRFPDRDTRNLDMAIFRKLHARYGNCKFNGIDGQYKAVFPGQLGNVKHDFEL